MTLSNTGDRFSKENTSSKHHTIPAPGITPERHIGTSSFGFGSSASNNALGPKTYFSECHSGVELVRARVGKKSSPNHEC